MRSTMLPSRAAARLRLYTVALLYSMLLGTSTQAQPGPPPGGPPPLRASGDIDYRAELTVAKDRYLRASSLAAAAVGARASDVGAANLHIRSDAPARNGIIVHGGAVPYTVSDSDITLSGDGSNDFEGIGAGALVDAGGTLVLKSVRITTNGVLRSATTAREGSVLKVYDSTLVAHGGPLPTGYVPKIGPGMMEAPAPLGIKGTARAHLSTSKSKTYFYNSTIVADGWGALSTDDTGGDVYLEANDCRIEVNNSGYGTYADFGATVVLNRTRVKAATFAGIIAGAGKIVLNAVEADTGANAVMIHSVIGDPQEKGVLTLAGGHYATAKSTVLVKSANADITIDGARLQPADGVLVRSVVNDDPNATRIDGKTVPGIRLDINNAQLNGDILHLDTARGMALALQHSQLRGAIRNAAVRIGRDSRWTATADSVVTLADDTALGQLDAPRGVTIVARADAGSPLLGEHTLPGGGRLTVDAR